MALIFCDYKCFQPNENTSCLSDRHWSKLEHENQATLQASSFNCPAIDCSKVPADQLVTYLLVHSALMSHLARVKVMWISTGPFRASSSRAPSMCLEDEMALPLYLHHCPQVEFYKHLRSSLGNAHQDRTRSDIWLHLPVVLKFDPSSPASPTQCT